MVDDAIYNGPLTFNGIEGDWGLSMPDIGAPRKRLLGLSPKTLGRFGEGLKASAGAIGGIVGSVGQNLISNGFSSGAGNAVGNIGGQLGGAISTVNPVVGGIVSAASGVIGGGLNRLVGMKTNQAALNAANKGNDYYRSFHSNAGNFDDIQSLQDVGSITNPYKGGLLKKSKARRLNNALKQERTDAMGFAQRDIDNNIDNLNNQQVGNFLKNYAAYGGPLDFITDSYGMGAINYGLMSDYMLSRRDRANRADSTKQVTIPGYNGFALGGDVQVNGGDFTDGMSYINAGGTHEDNAHGGVQVGVDSQGVPNLVEEGEVIYKDYVYSNRIEVDEDTKKKFHISKKANKTFADLAKKLEREVQETPNDPISKAGLDKMMEMLKEEQERQKAELEAKRAKAMFDSLSPEEQVALMQAAINGGVPEGQAQEQMPEETMQQPTEVPQDGVEVAAPSPEEIAAAEQQEAGAVDPDALAQQTQAMPADAAMPQQMAEGGAINRYDWGGTFDDWWNALTGSYTSDTPMDYNRLYQSIVGSTGNYEDEEGLRQALQIYFNEHPEALRPYDISNYAFYPDTRTVVTNPNINAGTITGDSLVVKTPTTSTITTETGEPVKMKHSTTSKLRYVPAIGGAIGLFSDLFSRPNYSRAQGIIDASNGYSPMFIAPTLLGDYVRTEPMDILAQQNRNRADFRGTDRALRNSGGNAGSIGAGLLANAYNGIIANGDLYTKGLEYNNANRRADAEFNRGTHQTNAQNILAAQEANQNAWANAQQHRLTGLIQGYNMMDNIDERRARSLSANLGNVLTSIGNIGEEAYDADRLKWLERTGTLKSDYYNQGKYGKYGGMLTRKKKGGKH